MPRFSELFTYHFGRFIFGRDAEIHQSDRVAVLVAFGAEDAADGDGESGGRALQSACCKLLDHLGVDGALFLKQAA